jgi:short-subunit dehydrogenase
MLEARAGAVVTVASVSGIVGIAGQTNYAATKGA